MILFVIVAVLCIILGLVMIFKPEEYYTMTQSWKHNERTDPSETYLKRTRAAGVVQAVGVSVLLILFLYTGLK